MTEEDKHCSNLWVYILTYVWNLKKLQLRDRGAWWLPGFRGMLVRVYKLTVIRQISSGDLSYSTVTIVQNTILYLKVARAHTHTHKCNYVG